MYAAHLWDCLAIWRLVRTTGLTWLAWFLLSTTLLFLFLFLFFLFVFLFLFVTHQHSRLPALRPMLPLRHNR